MPTDVRMPKLADTLVEGTLARWLKSAHETVQQGEPIAEIETDKVTTELTAPESGTLGDLLVSEGQTVPIGTPLVQIFVGADVSRPGSPIDTPVGAGEDVAEGLGRLRRPSPPEDEVEETSALSNTSHTEEAGPSPSQPKRSSPLAARIAEAHGVDLSCVQALGSRITRMDVERHLTQSPSAAIEAGVTEQFTTTGGASAPSTHSHLRGTTGGASAPSPLPHPLPPLLRDELVPLTGLRRATAQRMALVHRIPTGCAVVEVDITAVDDVYKKEREAWLAREGFPLTYTPYFIHALAQSLRVWPAVLMSFANGRSEPREGVHVGVAVALDDGLIVPVIRNADQKDFAAIARAQNDLVSRARAHRLRPEEVTGGVATLTNVGSMGGLLALPMLNENQAVILGMGAITRRAVGIGSSIQYRSYIYLSLTFDRRLLDDLQAERFLLDVAKHIET